MFAGLVPRFLKKKKILTNKTCLASLIVHFHFCFQDQIRFLKSFKSPQSFTMNKKNGIFGPVTKKLSEAWIAKLGSTAALLPESHVQVKTQKKSKFSYYFNFVAKYQILNSRRRKCDLRKNLHNYLQR
jgi:hypothetical protein